MKNLAVARRYAKALLLIGKENGQAYAYRDELNGFATMVTGNQTLKLALDNPLYDAADRKRVLQTLSEKLELSVVMKSFLLLLFDKGRIGFLSDVNDFYQKLADELKGIARASIVSASDLTPATIDQIRKSLSKMTGKEIKLDVDQDPSLIGGIVSRIGDLVLDGSIKTQLLNMRESLKRGESV